jgi:hypothetical protein
MLKIDETKKYSKLEKAPNSKHPWNIKEGVVFEGIIRAEIKAYEGGVQYLWVEKPDGRYLRTSPIDRILPNEDGLGYKIYTANSLYILT